MSKINFLNSQGNKLSTEMVAMTAVMCCFVEGATRVCNIVHRAMLAEGVDHTLYHNNKREFNVAADMMRKTLYHMNNAFDNVFDMIIQDEGERADGIGYMAMDMVQMAIIYLDRADRDPRNRERIRKKIREYKPIDIDEDAILDLLKIR